MSKFLHHDDDADDARDMPNTSSFSSKTAELKISLVLTEITKYLNIKDNCQSHY